MAGKAQIDPQVQDVVYVFIRDYSTAHWEGCVACSGAFLDTLAQQLVKLFRYDKARFRVTNVLESYVEKKRKSIR